MARATDSFPDPAAPTSRTVVSLRASFFACAKTCFNAGLSPTISSEPDPGRISSCTCTFFPNQDRKSTRLNSSHSQISYAVFCLKKKTPEVILDRFSVLPELHHTFANGLRFAPHG